METSTLDRKYQSLAGILRFQIGLILPEETAPERVEGMTKYHTRPWTMQEFLLPRPSPPGRFCVKYFFPPQAEGPLPLGLPVLYRIPQSLIHASQGELHLIKKKNAKHMFKHNLRIVFGRQSEDRPFGYDDVETRIKFFPADVCFFDPVEPLFIKAISREDLLYLKLDIYWMANLIWVGAQMPSEEEVPPFLRSFNFGEQKRPSYYPDSVY